MQYHCSRRSNASAVTRVRIEEKRKKSIVMTSLSLAASARRPNTVHGVTQLIDVIRVTEKGLSPFVTVAIPPPPFLLFIQCSFQESFRFSSSHTVTQTDTESSSACGHFHRGGPSDLGKTQRFTSVLTNRSRGLSGRRFEPRWLWNGP